MQGSWVGGSIGPEGRYVLSEELGSGPMGAVYLALDSVLQRGVVVKFLEPEIAGKRARPQAV